MSQEDKDLMGKVVLNHVRDENERNFIREKHKRVIIYCRVSTEDQEDNTSWESQEKDCREYCEKNGLTVIDVVFEQYTGTVWMERKKFMSIRDRYMSGEIQGIVVRKYDRFTRSIIHFFYLLDEMQNLGVEIYAAFEAVDLKTPMGKMMAALSLGFSEQEVATTRERSMRGKKERVTGQGKYNASVKAKYGYQWNDSKTKAKLVAKENEARVVSEIIKRRADREAYYSIAVDLNKRAVPSPGGKEWRIQTVKRIVEDGEYLYRGVCIAFKERYTRIYKDGKRVIHREPIYPLEFLPDGTVERLVSDEIAFAALSVRDSIKQDNPRANKGPITALVRGGIARCGNCKSSLIVAGRRSVNKSPIYKCSCVGKPGRVCTGPATITVQILDIAVWKYVTTLVEDITIIEEVVAELLKKDKFGSIEQSIKKSKKECEDIISGYRQDLKTETRERVRVMIRDDMNTQAKQLEKLEKDLENMQRGRERQDKVKQALVRFVEWARSLKEKEEEEQEDKQEEEQREEQKAEKEKEKYRKQRDHLRTLGISVVVYPEKDETHDRYEFKVAPGGLLDAINSHGYALSRGIPTSLAQTFTVPLGSTPRAVSLPASS